MIGKIEISVNIDNEATYLLEIEFSGFDVSSICFYSWSRKSQTPPVVMQPMTSVDLINGSNSVSTSQLIEAQCYG